MTLTPHAVLVPIASHYTCMRHSFYTRNKFVLLLYILLYMHMTTCIYSLYSCMYSTAQIQGIRVCVSNEVNARSPRLNKMYTRSGPVLTAFSPRLALVKASFSPSLRLVFHRV